jgi:Na+-driven multidrug efflux pump
VAWLVLPVLVEQLLALSVGFTDKWLAGNLLAGAEYLAAVGLVAYCLAFLPALFAIPAVRPISRPRGGRRPNRCSSAAG